MKRFIMILLVAAMALTMFACGKEVTSSESSLSTVSMPESSSLHTNSAPPLPESSSAPSNTQVTPQKEYIEKLVSYIPEGLDLKEYIVGKWHMAYRDEDGYFWFVGRNDDLIKSSGYRVSPFEVESVLLEHPAVREVAVTGVPDPSRGQAVKATIVLNKYFQATDVLVRQLQDYVKSHTAHYKSPRVIEFVDMLPMTISGKIRRALIRTLDSAKESIVDPIKNSIGLGKEDEEK